MAVSLQGTFSLQDRASGKLQKILDTAAAADKMLDKLGDTMDKLARPDRIRKLDEVQKKVRGIGKETQAAARTTDQGTRSMGRSFERMSAKATGAIEVVRKRLRSLGREKAKPEIELGGFAGFMLETNIAIRQIRKLNREMAKAELKAMLGGITAGAGSLVSKLISGGSSVLGALGKVGGGILGVVSNFSLMGVGITLVLAALPPLAAALGALTASLGAAAAGLGAFAVGGLGVGAVGLAGIAAIAIPAVKSLGNLKKAQDEYTKAVKESGKGSKQAAEAMKNLEAAQAKVGGFRMSQVSKLTSRWSKQTGPAQRSFFGILSDTLSTANAMLPTFARTTNTVLRSTRKAWGDFMDLFDTQFTRKVIRNLGSTWAKSVGPFARALGHIGQALGGIANAARPYVVKFFESMERWASRWAKTWMNDDKASKRMKDMVGHLKSWLDLFGAIWGLMKAIFAPAQKTGKNMVESMTESIERLTDKINKNPTSVADWFDRNAKKASDMADSVVKIVGALAKLADALTPLVDMVNGLIDALDKLPGGLEALLAVGLAAGVTRPWKNPRTRRNRRGGGGGAAPRSPGARSPGTGARPTPIPEGGSPASVPPRPPRTPREKPSRPGKRPPRIMRPRAPKLGRVGGPAALGTYIVGDMAVGRLINSRNKTVSGAGSVLDNVLQYGSMGSWIGPQAMAAGALYGLGQGVDQTLGGPEARSKANQMGGPPINGDVWSTLQYLNVALGDKLFGRPIVGGRSPSRKQVTAASNTSGTFPMTGAAAPLVNPARPGAFPAFTPVPKTGRGSVKEAQTNASAVGKAVGGTWKKIARDAPKDARKTRDEVSGAISSLKTRVVKSNDAMLTSTRTTYGKIVTEAAAKLRGLGVTAAAAATAASGGSTKKNAAGGRIGGRGLHDSVMVAPGNIAAPGELIVNRHTEARVNEKLARYGTTLGGEVGKESRPHSLPLSRGSNTGNVFHKASGRVSTIGGGVPTAMGALPGLAVLADFLKSKFGISVVSGLRPGAITTSGNVSDHSWGGAIDVSNGSSPTPQMDSAWKWLAKNLGGGGVPTPGVFSGGAIKQMLYRTMIGGNHFNHVHVALLSQFAHSAEKVRELLAGHGVGNITSYGGGGAATPTFNLRSRAGFSGGGPAHRLASQTAINNMIAGAEAYGRRKAGGGGGGGGGGAIRGKVSVFGPPLEGAGGTAYGFSSSQPGIAVNPGMTSTSWNDSSATRWARKLMRVQVGGHSAVLRVIDKGPSIPGRAIDITGAGAQKMGFNPANFPTDSIGTATPLANGGRVRWGGWFGGGGRITAHRPTLLGVGDGGTEDVTVTPRGQRRFGTTGLQVSVTIQNVNYSRPGDMKNAIKDEVGEAFRELAEELGMGVDGEVLA